MSYLLHMMRLSPWELDAAVARLERIGLEEKRLRSELLEQVTEFGFTRPRAEKSKRLLGNEFEFTLSRSQSTEIRDAEVEGIRTVCPSRLFGQLFLVVTKYTNWLLGPTHFFLANCRQPHRAICELRSVQQWLGHSDDGEHDVCLKPSRSKQVCKKVNEIFP
jgi:hypothetical protein